MNRERVLSLLANRREEIVHRFGVKKLGVFGSAARGEMREGSVSMSSWSSMVPRPFDGYMDLKFYLDDLFGRSVDVMIEDTVKPRMWPLIEKI